MNEVLTRLLKAQDVAAIMNIPVATLRKNVSFNPDSVPPSIKLGNASNSPVRWRLEDVNKWIEDKALAAQSKTTTQMKEFI